MDNYHKLIFGIFVITGLSLSMQTILAQEDENAELDADTKLVLTLSPSIVEPGQATHSVGFVSIENFDDEGVPSSKDIQVKLESSDPEIVFVDPFVVIHQDDQYAKFDVLVGQKEGKVDITASVGNVKDTASFQVGGIVIEIVEEINLKINYPQEEMHSNSEMPISVVLVNESEDVLQAPDDLKITLEYSEGLITPKDTELLIEKGSFFAETVLSSGKEVGTGFIKASNEQLGINTISQITITSTKPRSLQISVFPDTVGFTEDRFNIFVSVLDSSDNPTVATEDIKLELFTDDLLISETLEEDIPDFGPLAPIIRKGEFSWYTTVEFQFQEAQKTVVEADPDAAEDEEEEETGILIGVSSPDLGIASTLLDIDDPSNPSLVAAADQEIKVFTIPTIPRGVESMFVYQLISSIEEDEDEEDAEVTETPLQSNINFSPLASDISATQRFSLISDNTKIIAIETQGPLTSGDSFGTSIIVSKQELGTATLATTFEGIGTATTEIEVIDTLAPDSTAIFTASGGDKILFDNEGNAQLYIMLLDSAGRPTVSNNDIEYVITPENDLIKLESFNSYMKTNIQYSNLPELVNNRTNIELVPVGVEPDDNLAVITSFEIQPRSTIVKLLPGLESLTTDGSTKREKIGIVQVVDPFGNPIVQNEDLQVLFTFGTSTVAEGEEGEEETVISEEIGANEILRPPLSVIIPKGESYTDFYITVFGRPGSEVIHATAEGIQSGSSAKITVNEFFKQLLLYIPPPLPMEVGEAVTMDLFVDDEYGDSIADVDVSIIANNVTVIPPFTTTNEFGGFSITVSPTSETASFTIDVSKFGYEGESKLVTLDVAPGEVEQTTLLGVDPIIIYAAVGIMVAIIAGMAVKFLRKPPEAVDEEEEEL